MLFFVSHLSVVLYPGKPGSYFFFHNSLIKGLDDCLFRAIQKSMDKTHPPGHVKVSTIYCAEKIPTPCKLIQISKSSLDLCTKLVGYNFNNCKGHCYASLCNFIKSKKVSSHQMNAKTNDLFLLMKTI